ncbi:MAG: hypothetical protein H7281_15180 [Bacteriovorax sp.]|nr:hypothetical protein [Bacteriovorax sp.]
MKFTYMFVVLISIIISLQIVSSSFAEDQIGGQWHQETIDAWKEYNNGKDLSEDDLSLFLVHGTFKSKIRFYEIACNKGSGNFCYLAGWSQNKNKKKAAEFYKKGCDITNELSLCLAAKDSFLDLDQIQQAKDVFKKVCVKDVFECSFGADSGLVGYKKFRRMLLEACEDGHAVSCSILSQYKITHKTPPSANREETDLNAARAKDNDIEVGWDGKYVDVNCNTIKVCEKAGNQKSKYYVEKIPYFAKACELGGGSSCFVVGQYEEEQRKDEKAAYFWFKKGCDNAPEATGLCFAAIDAKLMLNEIEVATALFMKSCTSEKGWYCEIQILDNSKNETKLVFQKRLSTYKKMLTQACNDKHKVACKILRKIKIN